MMQLQPLQVTTHGDDMRNRLGELRAKSQLWLRRNRIAGMKNRDLINALSKMPSNVDVYVSVEPEQRPSNGAALLACAISKVESWEDAQALVISPVRRRPKSFARKPSSTRHNLN
jgi:hypothetical protein